MPMQIKRHLGAVLTPTTLAEGQLAYNDPDVAPLDDQLFIGSESSGNPVIRTLVSSLRQVEISGAQTIVGAKTIAVTALHVTGGANNNILSTDGNGNLTWTAAPSGGLLAVAVDAIPSLGGDGTTGSPLSVLRWATARDITIETRAAQPDGSITTINVVPASVSGAGNAAMTQFAITRLDDGTY